LPLVKGASGCRFGRLSSIMLRIYFPNWLFGIFSFFSLVSLPLWDGE
jgi:hypothetical protein